MDNSLVEKLKLVKYKDKAIVNRPNSEYFSELKDAHEGWPSKPVDLMIIFVETLDRFKTDVANVIDKQLLNQEGILLIAYPKKGNKQYATYVHRDEIFPALEVNDEDGYIKDSTLKFNRMIRLDQTFTVIGIKNTIEPLKKKTVSGRSSDYVQFIPTIEKMLVEYPEIKKTFENLTPGHMSIK